MKRSECSDGTDVKIYAEIGEHCGLIKLSVYWFITVYEVTCSVGTTRLSQQRMQMDRFGFEPLILSAISILVRQIMAKQEMENYLHSLQLHAIIGRT